MVELLVVLAIIGIVFGLVLVAVGRVRETANIAQSKNNLRQVVLATHAFAGSHHGSLPQLGDGKTLLVRAPDGTQTLIPGKPGPALFVQILPYIGHELTPTKKKKKSDFKPVETFISPSDPSAAAALEKSCRLQLCCQW
jgi:type II secretory pathway pseudopilin PulG